MGKRNAMPNAGLRMQPQAAGTADGIEASIQALLLSTEFQLKQFELETRWSALRTATDQALRRPDGQHQTCVNRKRGT